MVSPLAAAVTQSSTSFLFALVAMRVGLVPEQAAVASGASQKANAAITRYAG
jgi:hypothetical protein